jgi:hypothetical protein
MDGGGKEMVKGHGDVRCEGEGRRWGSKDKGARELEAGLVVVKEVGTVRSGEDHQMIDGSHSSEDREAVRR